MSTNTHEPHTLTELEDQLRSRDEIIAALTAQLEDSAKKLERIDRQGGRQASASPGLPAELVKRQVDLTEQFEQVLESWQEFQPVERLVRIDEGVERLLTLLTAEGSLRDSSETKSPDNQEFWQAAKAKLLGDAAETSVETPSTSESTPTTASPETASVPNEQTCELPPVPEPPQPLDDEADTDTLWQAIDDREVYIQYLTSRLRQAEQSRSMPVPWHELDNAPTDLKLRIQELEQQLTSHLKEAEIANALERASLTRERAKLYRVKQQLEKQVHRLKVATAMPSNEESTSHRKESGWDWFFSKEKK